MMHGPKAITALLALAVLSGCQGPSRVAEPDARTAKLARTRVQEAAPKPTSGSAIHALLIEIGRFTIKRPYYEGIGQLGISRSGRLIAVKEQGASDAIEIHWIPSGKLAAKFRNASFSFGSFSWHPNKDILAFAGGRANDARTATEADGAYYVLNGQDGRPVAKIPVASGVSSPVAWTPDGAYLITTKGSWVGGDLVNVASKRVSPSDFGNVEGLQLSMSPDWVLASEQSRVYTEPPMIELYKAKAGIPKSFTKIRSLTAGSGTFRTQPAFLLSGKLAFIKVFVNNDGSGKRVEIWTSKEDGTDERAWLRLPPLSEGADGKFSVVPVAWSPDGHIVAYTQGTTVVINSVVAR